MIEKYMPYAGIGSRQTPPEVLSYMERMGSRLNHLGFTLRSGGANGADSAFEINVGPNKEIFLPWDGFNDRNTVYKGLTVPFSGASADLYLLAESIARENHPNWEACKRGARAMHVRNVAQVLGADLLTPSLFVVCWTPNGSGSGGTGQAIRIARKYGIPVYDLGKENWKEDIEKLTAQVLELVK